MTINRTTQPEGERMVHFISAKADQSGNVTACGLDFVYPMHGNGWRVRDLTCPDCDRVICDAAHGLIRSQGAKS